MMIAPGKSGLLLAGWMLGMLPGCALRPSSLDLEQRYIVAIKSARLPASQPWFTQFAEHTWVDIKDEIGWRRVEIITRRSGVITGGISSETAERDLRWRTKPVHVLTAYYGDRAKTLGTDILAIAKEFPLADSYRAWPGPNSNTFIDWLVRQVPGLRADLYPNAVGRDYAEWVRAGPTATDTGLELETPYLGLQVGLIEGAEIHLLGLTLGVGLWPPALKLPFLPAIPFGFFTQ